MYDRDFMKLKLFFRYFKLLHHNMKHGVKPVLPHMYPVSTRFCLEAY